MPEMLCLHCMKGRVIRGRCECCGQPPVDRDRVPEALPFGMQLRSYLLGRVLGKGGFGITYMAWDTKRNKRTAVKELFPSYYVTRDPRTGFVVVKDDQRAAEFFGKMKVRFKEEAQNILQFISYPEIIDLYELFERNQTVYYVMEYLEGEDLGRMLRRRGSIPWPQLEPMIWSITGGLKLIHDRGLIHRDISPDNLFIEKSGEAKLIDFGSVRHMRTGSDGEMIKREFAPVELFDSQGRQGPWSDIYSLSATIYYILTRGKLPAVSIIRRKELSQGRPDPLLPIQRLAHDVPDYVARGVMQGLNITAEGRIQNVEQFRSIFFPRSNNPALCWQLVGLDGCYTGQRFPLKPGRISTVGRSATGENGYRPEHFISFPNGTPGISRKQCAFSVSGDGSVQIQDLGSSYGTFVNRRRLEPYLWVPLGAGSVVSFGNERFRLVQMY